MPGCCVPMCKNRTESGYRLFQLPQGVKNEQRRQVWMYFINRIDLPFRAHVCEAHFEEMQFETQRHDRRKLFKWNAVPTIAVAEFQSFPHQKRTTGENDVTTKRTEPLTVKPEVTNLEDNIERENESTATICCDQWWDNEQYQNLKTKLKNAEQTIQSLQQQVKKMEETYKELFTEDQITFLRTGSHRGLEWSDESINRGLKLYAVCGPKGYEEIRKQKLPYPSIRTLQSRIKQFKFEAGVLTEVFELLQLKISTLLLEEKHALLLTVEMAIQARLQYDKNSTNKVIGMPTMALSGNANNLKNILATHALAFMLSGLSSGWKQTICYEFTANSYCAKEALQLINKFIDKSTLI